MVWNEKCGVRWKIWCEMKNMVWNEKYGVKWKIWWGGGPLDFQFINMRLSIDFKDLLDPSIAPQIVRPGVKCHEMSNVMKCQMSCVSPVRVKTLAGRTQWSDPVKGIWGHFCKPPQHLARSPTWSCEPWSCWTQHCPCCPRYPSKGRCQKKTRLCGKNSQVADPLPQFGKPLLSKKKVGFIFHFRTSGTFLVFTKKSPFWVIDWNYVVGIGDPPLRDARFLHFPQKENIVKC